MASGQPTNFQETNWSNLPYDTVQKLYSHLDTDDLYEKLACEMKFKADTLDALKKEQERGKSPSAKLLFLWDNLNHSVTELFIVLGRVQLVEAMELLKQFVDPRVHHLIKAAKKKKEEAVNEKKVQNKGVHDQVVSDDNNESGPVAPVALQPQKSEVSLPQIPFDDLRNACDNWNPKHILGAGGFGCVFKGLWKHTEVAIKQIRCEKNDDKQRAQMEQMEQTITELRCLNGYPHENILQLYGYSMGGPQPCLVYQYMKGGSLEKRLHPKSAGEALKWPTRLSIAIGTARGLQYLHTLGPIPLIHGDIKSANILLDSNDSPRIGDFGLAREGPDSAFYSYMKVSQIRGTEPYLPSEFVRNGKFSPKVDTYSFGVVLFELATGRKAAWAVGGGGGGATSNKSSNKKFLKDFVADYRGDLMDLRDKMADSGGWGFNGGCDLIDFDSGRGGGVVGEREFRGLMRVGLRCVEGRVRQRPEMVEVLTDLEGIKCDNS